MCVHYNSALYSTLTDLTGVMPVTERNHECPPSSLVCAGCLVRAGHICSLHCVKITLLFFLNPPCPTYMAMATNVLCTFFYLSLSVWVCLCVSVSMSVCVCACVFVCVALSTHHAACYNCMFDRDECCPLIYGSGKGGLQLVPFWAIYVCLQMPLGRMSFMPILKRL